MKWLVLLLGTIIFGLVFYVRVLLTKKVNLENKVDLFKILNDIDKERIHRLEEILVNEEREARNEASKPGSVDSAVLKLRSHF